MARTAIAIIAAIAACGSVHVAQGAKLFFTNESDIVGPGYSAQAYTLDTATKEIKAIMKAGQGWTSNYDYVSGGASCGDVSIGMQKLIRRGVRCRRANQGRRASIRPGQTRKPSTATCAHSPLQTTPGMFFPTSCRATTLSMRQSHSMRRELRVFR